MGCCACKLWAPCVGCALGTYGTRCELCCCSCGVGGREPWAGTLCCALDLCCCGCQVMRTYGRISQQEVIYNDPQPYSMPPGPYVPPPLQTSPQYPAVHPSAPPAVGYPMGRAMG